MSQTHRPLRPFPVYFAHSSAYRTDLLLLVLLEPLPLLSLGTYNCLSKPFFITQLPFFWPSFASTLCLLTAFACRSFCLMPSHCLPHAQFLNTCAAFPACPLCVHCFPPSFCCLITACILPFQRLVTARTPNCLSTLYSLSCLPIACPLYLSKALIYPVHCLFTVYPLSTQYPLFPGGLQRDVVYLG